MMTKKVTYSSQIMRDRVYVSQKMQWLKRSENQYSRQNAETGNLAGPRKMRITSVQNPTSQMLASNSIVTILTLNSVAGSEQRISKKHEEMLSAASGKIELKESKMKDVLGNISRYAISAIVSLSMVMAQGTPKLDIRIEDQKINLSDTEKKDASLVTYFPGDTIRYVLTASNTGDGLMKNPEIVDPIPGGVTYVVNSAKGEGTEITYSMNQGKAYMAWPPFYTVRNSKGILVKREATPEMISHIKWNILSDLTPGETTAMEFLVVVNK